MASALEELPLDLSIRCVALLPIANGPSYRSASRALAKLGGSRLAHCRACLGICELRLLGAVAGDPRTGVRSRQAPEAARIQLALDPDSASKAKELFSIKGPELEAVVEGVDRAASSLELDVDAGVQSTDAAPAVEAPSGGLRDWDNRGSMSEFEAYAVLQGCLHLVGPNHLGGQRWMMRMRDSEERFAQLQNARLYIAGLQAEYSPAVKTAPAACALQVFEPGRSCSSQFLHINGMRPKGIRGRLLFCAVEV